MKRVFIGYPNRVKGYKIWWGEQKKCIIYRDIVFHKSILLKESVTTNFNKYTDNNFETVIDISKLKVEFSNDKYHEKEEYDYKNGTNGGVEDISLPDLQQFDLQNYQLAKDRIKRQTKASVKYGYIDLIAYPLLSADDIEEPRSYSKPIESEDNVKWLFSMQKVMDSLQRNHT